MFAEVGSGGAATALARFRDAVTALLTLPLGACTDGEVLAVLRSVETEKNRLPTADHAVIAELDTRGVAHKHACASTANLLSQVLRISPGEPPGGSGPPPIWDLGAG